MGNKITLQESGRERKTTLRSDKDIRVRVLEEGYDHFSIADNHFEQEVMIRKSAMPELIRVLQKFCKGNTP